MLVKTVLFGDQRRYPEVLPMLVYIMLLAAAIHPSDHILFEVSFVILCSTGGIPLLILSRQLISPNRNE